MISQPNAQPSTAPATDNAPEAGSVTCKSCGHENAEGAKFCAECATPTSADATPQSAPVTRPTPQPPVPPVTPRFTNQNFGGPAPTPPGRGQFGVAPGRGQGSQHRIAANADTAFQQIASSIQANGGEVTWQSGSHSANFTCIKKQFLAPKMKFEGSFSITPVSDTESVASIEVKPDWGNVMGNVLFSLGCMLVAIICNPMLMPLFMLLTIVGVGYTVWGQTVDAPSKMTDAFLRTMPKSQVGGAPANGFNATPSKPRVPFGMDIADRLKGKLPGSLNSLFTPPSTAPAPPQMPVTPPAPPAVKSPVERIKELASLKEIGAISEEEFEAKKAELLKAI